MKLSVITFTFFSSLVYGVSLSAQAVKIDERQYQDVQIRIPLQPGYDLNQIQIEMPACKYDKTFALSFSGDDSLMGIYQRAFHYIHGRYVDNKDIFHADCETPTTGITPTRELVYTDGCGNDIPFRLGVNWMQGKVGQSIHQNGNKWLAYMNWLEGMHFLDFYNGIFNHGGGDQTKQEESVLNNQEDIYTNLNYKPYILGIPGGTNGYPEVGDSLSNLYALLSTSYQGSTQRNLILSNIHTDAFLKMKLGRTCLDSKGFDYIRQCIDPYAKDTRWVNLFCHNIKNSTATVNGQLNASDCFSFLDYVYDTYGKGGNDCVWFASDCEIFEYTYSRLFSTVSKQLKEGELVIDIHFAYLPNFTFNELSLKIKGDVAISKIKFSDQVVTASYGLDKDQNALINFSISDFTETRSQKYIQKYTQTLDPVDKRDALFFINRLVETRKQSYLKALESATDIHSASAQKAILVYVYNHHLFVKGIESNITGTLYRADGQWVRHLTLFPDSSQDLSEIPSGIYFLKLDNNQTIHYTILL